MTKEQVKNRRQEVKRTGKIPSGTFVHHRHLRNPPLNYLLNLYDLVKADMDAGVCHPDWGAKRIAAPEKLIDKKRKRLEK